jgi:RHS repeat-associated protein
VIAQSNGTLCYDGDFTPFGAERAYTNTCAQNYKFEGKERDTETQNDDFGAREYSWRFGRWLSSDWSAVPVPVPYANLSNPQTLNLYAMVADDPESFADLDGHEDGAPAGGDSSSGDPSGGSPQGQAQTTQPPPQQPPQAQNQAPQVDSSGNPAFNPGTPDPAGVRAGSASDPSSSASSGSSTTSTPSDKTQAPKESRGQQGSRGRGRTGKPDKPPKGTRPAPGKPGRFEEWDKHKGNWVLKPPGWSPDTAKKVVIGAAIVTGAVVVGHAIAGCFASGACEVGLALAF